MFDARLKNLKVSAKLKNKDKTTKYTESNPESHEPIMDPQDQINAMVSKFDHNFSYGITYL